MNNSLWQLSFIRLFIIIFLVQNIRTEQYQKDYYKIAIIGGGVGGTSAAYFLDKLFNTKLAKFNYEIDIYEQSSNIGGRLATVKIDDDEYEAGGSIIHERNKYASDLSKKFGLPRKSKIDINDHVCIFNGEKFLFCESSWEVVTYAKLLYRYGIDPLRLEKRVSKVLDYFERIYELQQKEYAFEQVSDLLFAMSPSLYNLTKLSYRDLLLNDFKLSETFVDEIVKAVSLVNYGQTLSIHSFVGLVSYAGAGADLWSFDGGNKLLPEYLAKYSNARIFLNTKVVSIEYLRNHAFKVEYIKTDSSDSLNNSKVYDYVIIANPLTSSSQLKFKNITEAKDLLNGIFDKYQMHQTVATFIKGTVLDQYKELAILSCDIENNGKQGSFFTSLSQLTPVNATNYNHSKQSGIYKIFSNTPLKLYSLYKLFDDIQHIEEKKWNAYPEYKLNQPFPPIRIRAGLYYSNAIEWAASAIEMSLIGAKNAALLVCHDLKLCHSDTLNNTVYSKTSRKKVENTTVTFKKDEL